MDTGSAPELDPQPSIQRDKRRICGFLAAYPESADISNNGWENYLTRAIHDNDIEAVRFHLAAGANPLFSEPYDGPSSALSWAAIRGDRSITQLLLSAIPPAAHTSSATTYKGICEEDILHRCMVDAATHGHYLIVRDFLDARDYPRSTIGWALGAATRRWEVDVVEVLLERFTFDQNDLTISLNTAVKEKWGIEFENRYEEKYFDTDPDKQARLVSRLLKETKPNLQDPTIGPPLLREAIFRSEQQGALRVLLDQGIDPNTQWGNGETSLHLLAVPHYCSLYMGMGEGWVNEAGIALLLEHGASITIKNHNNEMAFQLAAEFANTDIFLRYYMPDKPGLLSMNESRETLLHRAAAGGKRDTAEYLLSRGCFDVNAVNSTGWTPLICALVQGCSSKSEDMAVETARCLLDANADPLIKTADGRTLLHLLGSFGNPGPVKEPQDEALKIEKESSADEYEGDFDDISDYEVEEWDSYDRTTAAADLVRELLTASSELRALVHHPARVFYSTEKQMHFRSGSYEEVEVYVRSNGTSDRPEENVRTAKEQFAVEGLTPLHWAAEHGAAGVAAVLIDVGGADIEARDSKGATPLDTMHRTRGSIGAVDPIQDALEEILSS